MRMGDVAAAMQQLDDHRPAKSSLMKKLSSLLHPKKSKSKSGSASQKSQASTGSELELLFAQAEATLGELLVRAGASFEARSSSYSHADQHHADDVSSALISSGSRSATFSGQGHARRRSLSRVWQQLGGSLFCGSGHMSSYVMDHDMIMAPAPSKGVYEDVVLDEAYWQSLADAMLLQQRRQLHDADAKLAPDAAANELSCRDTKEVQNDEPRVLHCAELLQEEADRESEIVVCGSTSTSTGPMSLQDMDSICYREVLESGGGCARLNTTLDESPNLAHNYIKVGGTTPSTSSVYSFPQPNLRDEVSSSSSMQPLERFLRQAALSVAVSESSASSRSAPELFACHEPAGTTSCRVSLMTLLHEEAAAADSTTTLEARHEEEEEAEGEAEAAPAELLDEEGWRARSMRSTMQVGEDPLLCCVCMIRRKGAALIPCGHTFCRTCAKQLFAGRGACPLCNNLIVQVLDIF